MEELVYNAYKIGKENDAILNGNLKLGRDVNCLLFAFYCEDTPFYKHLFKVSKEIRSVNRKAKKTIKNVKKILKDNGFKKIWSRGIFSLYGDLRPLAVEAGFGKWGENGLIHNDIYGSNFLIVAIYFK
ncbi:hypothetical protein [Clostridium sp.]|uniref:hypothetical protein n=1 Tax=Clostridium sp. TaxID=1506 RepID=UPI003F2E7945